MNLFHVYFDTSLLHSTPFGHPHFVRLLHRVQQGVARLYVPLIALEERRTQLLDELDQHVAAAASKLNELKRGELGMILGGLPEVQLTVPSRDETDRASIVVLKKYLDDHKIEVLPANSEHGEKVWRRYFRTLPPFNPKEKRSNRRKDIPDAWILEAVLGNLDKPGRHCVLTKDNRLQETFEEAHAEVWNDIGALDAVIEAATAVFPIRPAAPATAAVSLDQLRSKEFEHLDRILLGLIETWGSPPKEVLFSQLEILGTRRQFSEAQARILELSGFLNDTGSHLIPTNRETAILASKDPLVQALLLKALDHGF